MTLRLSPCQTKAAVAGRDRARLMDVLRGLLASWVVLHHVVLIGGFDAAVDGHYGGAGSLQPRRDIRTEATVQIVE